MEPTVPSPMDVPDTDVTQSHQFSRPSSYVVCVLIFSPRESLVRHDRGSLFGPDSAHTLSGLYSSVAIPRSWLHRRLGELRLDGQTSGRG